MATSKSASLPYEEPSVSTILVLSSFLLLLNAVNHIFDKLIFCGLVGQVLLGIAWGTPGARFLNIEAEHFIVNLGYLGLILLVYEGMPSVPRTVLVHLLTKTGGLSTSFKSLKANIYLSVAVALTGISLPIALSFVLLKLVNATPLQAFAAGAALCSTSLGTTFAVLKASGLVRTKMGVVLSTAAMMDDVVGLVMVQVISNLGSASSQSFSAITVVRPVLVSLAFAVLTPVCTYVIARPATSWLNGWREQHPSSKVAGLIKLQSFAVTVHTGFLIAMVVGSSYAGTSNLFAAYLAGATACWWDTEIPHPLDPASPPPPRKPNVNIELSTEVAQAPRCSRQSISGVDMFDKYYGQALARILKPFFFASIGFSIPVAELFNGKVVWRGFIYALLMFMGKLACGLWLLKLPAPNFKWAKTWLSRVSTLCRKERNEKINVKPNHGGLEHSQTQPGDCIELAAGDTSKKRGDLVVTQSPRRSNEGRKVQNLIPETGSKSGIFSEHGHGSIRKPTSIYPSLILGSAMTARGEIGFLISSLAQSNNIFLSSQPSQSVNMNQDDPLIFLVVTWAIMLCTIIGPILVGILVRSVKAKEELTVSNPRASAKNILGDWGVE